MIIEHVIMQHAEDASFLWLLRTSGTRAPHLKLANLFDLDDRLEAHLDGLRVAGDEVWPIVNEQLAIGEAGEVFIAGVLALEGNNSKRIADVFGIASQNSELARPLVSALGWVANDVARPWIETLANGTPFERRVAMGASAVTRQDPGDVLVKAMADKDAAVRSRALRAVGELGASRLSDELERAAIADADADCRFWALWSYTLLGGLRLFDVLFEVAASEGSYAQRAQDLVGRAAPLTRSLALQRDLATNRATRRAAIRVAGAIGDPSLASWLIEQMHDPEVMQIAGESLSLITGLDICTENLDQRKPAPDGRPSDDDEEGESVELNADRDLPSPSPELIEEWWTKRSGDFQSGVRHVSGQPIGAAALIHVLRKGYQRQRAAAALELAVQRYASRLFEVRAPSFWQIPALRSLGRN